MLPKDLKTIIEYLNCDEAVSHIIETRRLYFKAFATTAFALWTRCVLLLAGCFLVVLTFISMSVTMNLLTYGSRMSRQIRSRPWGAHFLGSSLFSAKLTRTGPNVRLILFSTSQQLSDSIELQHNSIRSLPMLNTLKSTATHTCLYGLPIWRFSCNGNCRWRTSFFPQ